jgi:NAD-dependent SIR2 family protein deacetylase
MRQVADYEALVALVSRGGVVVLGGAGMSTESGIPDYRGPTGASRPGTPMTYQTFTGSSGARQRYWARSHLGWHAIARARPNGGHRAVAALQARGLLDGIITQNVDGLHQAAGACDVVELHGALDRVVCLRCAQLTSREALHARLSTANPGFARGEVAIRPDGDVDLDDVSGFHVVDCQHCGGLLKPDVVFFGETVPRDRVDRGFGLVEQARSLVVLGSSLTVMSGYRFVLRAAKLGTPVAIVNQGPTRGDAHAAVRVDAPLGSVLTAVQTAVAGATPSGGPGRMLV